MKNDGLVVYQYMGGTYMLTGVVFEWNEGTHTPSSLFLLSPSLDVVL